PGFPGYESPICRVTWSPAGPGGSWANTPRSPPEASHAHDAHHLPLAGSDPRHRRTRPALAVHGDVLVADARPDECGGQACDRPLVGMGPYAENRARR